MGVISEVESCNAGLEKQPDGDASSSKLLQVHSLATMISLKMEIPEDVRKEDPNGIALDLPNSIKLFSILPSRRECNIRKYSYLLPAEIIGIKSDFSSTEIDHHLSEFSSVFKVFEGEHPFHNYTARSKYKKQSLRTGHIHTILQSYKESSESEESNGFEKHGVDLAAVLDLSEENLYLSYSADSDEHPIC